MSKTKDDLKSDSRSVTRGPTAEATARYISDHAWTRDVISCGRVVLQMGGRKKNGLDWKVADLMADLYLDARCGWAGAEYNLEKAGMIEMLFGHVAGQVDDGDCFWDDVRWTLTDRGRRASTGPGGTDVSGPSLSAAALTCGGTGGWRARPSPHNNNFAQAIHRQAPADLRRRGAGQALAHAGPEDVSGARQPIIAGCAGRDGQPSAIRHPAS